MAITAVAPLRAALPAILARVPAASRAFATSVPGHPDRGSNQQPHPDAPDFSMENPFIREKRQCILCRYQIQVDYKVLLLPLTLSLTLIHSSLLILFHQNTRLLSQFVSSYTGKLYDRHITGLCAEQHERVKREIKKAQSCHYIPIIHKDVRFVKDPELYDPFRPERPNPF